MTTKGFAETNTNIETPNDVSVAEKPLKSDMIKPERVDINILKSRLQETESKEFKKNIHPNSYMLTAKRENPLFDFLYLINPSYFKLDAQLLSQSLKQNVLKIQYRSYQKVEGLVLPESMNITATNTNEQTTLNLNIKSVSLNQSLRFPFNIPKGYKAIELQ